MLTDEQIQSALRASRIVPLMVANPHGPFGLEQLAEAVDKIRARDEDLLARSISLRTATWQRLDEVAKKAATSSNRQLSASDIAAALLEQAVAGLD
jgi:hypothetical protein